MAKVNIANSQVVVAETRLAPYNNDYNEDANYHQILFRPEYAVQARELTQLQSIMQNQIERFGQHMFVNGTPVLGGGIDFASVTTLNLASTYAGVDIDVNDFANNRIQYLSNTNVLAQVIGVNESNDNDPPTLHVRYTTGDDFGPGDTVKVSGANVYANIVSTANAVSNGFAAMIYDSVYFVDGYFVKVPKQTIIVEKYRYAGANVIVGLEKNKVIVTENDDSSLLDPAAESSNFDAPGAHRFKFELNLSTRPLDTEDLEEFIELARFEDGVLTNRVVNTQYAELEEVLARRTFDESGNYTVRPFIGNVREKDDDEVYFTLSPGKAYVNGYEFETIAESRISVPKARTKANTIENYDLNLNYGNYVIVDNVAGTFDGTTMELVDMHSLPGHLVGYANSTVYNRTKIGTARVVDMNFYGGDSNTAARKHELYLTDTRFTAIASNASTTSAAINQITFRAQDASTQDHAYVNSTIRITSGPSAGYLGKITAYNGANRLATVNPNFLAIPTNATNYRIEFGFHDVESFVKHTSYTSGATSNANCNINLLNKKYRLGQEDYQYGAPAFISEPSLNKLVFAYPDQFIANGISTNSFFYRRKYSGVQFTDGLSAAITAGATEDFEGATASSGVASTVMNNFLIFVENSQGSTRANGEQVSGSVTVSGNPEQAVFNTALGAADTFTATIFAKMETSGAGAVPRVKTLVKANTKSLTTDTANGSFVSSYSSNTTVWLNAGQVRIVNPSKSTTVKQSLYISDVQKIVKIYNCNGASPAAGANLQSYADVTNSFLFDNGQRASYYDHASITLKPGYAAPRGPLIVCTRYYKTTTDSGYFNVDSYPDLNSDITEEDENIGTGYSLIPTYDDIPLRDAVDFRPVRQNASNSTPNFSLVGIKTPIPATDLQSSYSYYYGRRDLIVAMPNRKIELIQGEPALEPQFPSKPATGMTLYKLTIPPYTLEYNNVISEYVENKRYTMRDIGLIDQRLKNVEYYVTLNLLEKSAFDLTITDQNGLPRTKYGILAENFTGHELGAADRDDYIVAVDLAGKVYNGRAVPTANVESARLVPASSGTNIKFSGGQKATLTYTNKFLFGFEGATKTTDPQQVGDFIGVIRTDPETDVYYNPKIYDVPGRGGPPVVYPPKTAAPNPPPVGTEIEVGDPDPTEPTEALPPNPFASIGKPSPAVPVIQQPRGLISSEQTAPIQTTTGLKATSQVGPSG